MKVAAVAIMILAVAIAIVPMFTDCASAGRTLTLADGRQIAMKCHWTGRAELGLGLPLLGVGAVMFGAQRRQSRRVAGILGTTLGGVAVLLPTTLIGVCMNPDMPCVSIMRPALILAGSLVIGISLVIVGTSFGREDPIV
jgi:hypothetical protein